MGAGQCGSLLLSQILNKQPQARVTHEQLPWLPWERQPDAPGIRERLQRLATSSTNERFIGDVASFYLPYAAEAIQCDPTIRIVCLKRPQDEIVASFCRHLDQSSRFPINHWAKTPAPGWSHDPMSTRIFPQYDISDREQGLRRYWQEYYDEAERLQQQYPDNVRVWDTEILTTDAGVRELLTFVGIPHAEQVILTGQRPRHVNGDASLGAGSLNRTHPLDPRRCVVLVPFSGFIHQECDAGLKELERRGYPVRRVGGYANIDVGRSQMVTDALRDGFDETFWIDSDVGFDPDSLERLRSHNLPMVCGIYPQKGKRALACHVMPGSASMTFGKNGGLVELLYAATGFLLVRREVYLGIQEKTKLPMCNERFGHPMIPYFLSLIHPIEDGYWYLADDYAFCQRARASGYRIFADTTIRLWHVGQYRYGWEDAGMDRPRFDSFTMNFGDQRPANSINRDTAGSAFVQSPANPDAAAARPAPDTHSGEWPELEERPLLLTAHHGERGVGGEGGYGSAAINEFASQFHWPAEKPDVPAPPERDWLYPATRDLLANAVPADSRLIVEVGSWTGRSTRYLADLAPRASIVAIDHWEGSVEHEQDPELAEFLPRLFDTFLSESWEYRNRIIPLRARSVEGLRRVAAAGLSPDLVFIDADHQYDSVAADLRTSLDLFPGAAVVGDDWDWSSVRSAVETVTRDRNLAVEVTGNAWKIPAPCQPAASAGVKP
jgi:predicted O-methyltransferase YrrM